MKSRLWHGHQTRTKQDSDFFFGRDLDPRPRHRGGPPHLAAREICANEQSMTDGAVNRSTPASPWVCCEGAEPRRHSDKAASCKVDAGFKVYMLSVDVVTRGYDRLGCSATTAASNCQEKHDGGDVSSMGGFIMFRLDVAHRRCVGTPHAQHTYVHMAADSGFTRAEAVTSAVWPAESAGRPSRKTLASIPRY